MKIQSITKINIDEDNDPLYFIDGEKVEDVYSDNHLLRLLLGKRFNELWVRSTDDLSEDEEAAVWNLSYFDSLDDLEMFLKDNPSLLEDV